jgi:hypothetical protein
LINSDPNMEKSVETIVGFTHNMDKIHNTDVTTLNGVDFNAMRDEIFN